MKRCPSCQRTYADDTLVYCLEDGSALLSAGAGGYDMPATVIMHDPRPTSPPGPETFRPVPAQTRGQPQPVAPRSHWEHAIGLQAPAPLPATQGRGLSVATLVLAIAAFALLGFCFVGGATGVNESLIGGIFIFSIVLALVGAVLGIVAAARSGTGPQNSKAMAVVGLVLNCAFLLVTLLFLILGASGAFDS